MPQRAFFIIALAVHQAQSYSYGNNDDRVLFNDIRALTFRAGKMTASRRVGAVQQLECTGGRICSEYPIRTVQCKNVGSDGRMPQWECQASGLSDEVALETNDIVCEGWERSGDNYVLRGSCALEYTLRRTGKRSSSDRYDHSHSYSPDYNFNRGHSGGFGGIWTYIILGGVGFVAYQFMCASNGQRNRGYGRNGGTGGDGWGAGGGGGGGGNGAGNQGWGGSGSRGGGCNNGNVNANGYFQPQQQRGYGGFWNGMGMGALAGYFMGGMGRQRYGYGGYNRGGMFGGYTGNRYGYGHPGGARRGGGMRFGGGGMRGFGGGTRTATSFAGSRSR